MSSKSYDAVLNEARQLSPEEQQRLILELAAPPAPETNGNGAHDAPPCAEGTVRTLYDALKERGLIGFITDGPGDLSTNPIHMEGFGKDAQ